MKKAYRDRVMDYLNLIDATINQSIDVDCDLVRATERLGRRMRTKSNIKRNYKKKGKYGRLDKNNKENYRKDVNFMYYQTNSSIKAISDHLGISQTSVEKLISAKPIIRL